MAKRMNKKNTRSWRRRVTKPSISCRGQTYKTSLCDNWSLYGTCPYGDKCQYAHGVAERRVRPNTKIALLCAKIFWKLVDVRMEASALSFTQRLLSSALLSQRK